MPDSRVFAEFLKCGADPQDFWRVFDFLPGVFYFVKDTEGRYVAASSASLSRLGVKTEAELIGRTSDDFYPPDVAQAYRRDDQQVIRTGRPVANRLELSYDEQHHLEWFLTTKVPVRGQSGQVVGIMGVMRRYDHETANDTVSGVTTIVEFIRANLEQNPSVADIGRACAISERQVHRRVREMLGETPHGLVVRMRVKAAAESLATTDEPIASIAVRLGFSDQSSFSQIFRKRTGLSPKQFRQRYGTSGAS